MNGQAQGEGGEGRVVTVKLLSQIDDGDVRELGAYELRSPGQTPACVARILREVADEFESDDLEEVLEGDD